MRETPRRTTNMMVVWETCQWLIIGEYKSTALLSLIELLTINTGNRLINIDRTLEEYVAINESIDRVVVVVVVNLFVPEVMSLGIGYFYAVTPQ